MNNIVITAAQIAEWKEREKELEEELTLIRKRLDAVSLFTDLPSLGSPLENLSPADAILTVVEEAKTPMLSSAILDELKKCSYPESKLGQHNSYFYSVMNRLVKRNRLTKKDGEYQLAQTQMDLEDSASADRPVPERSSLRETLIRELRS